MKKPSIIRSILFSAIVAFSAMRAAAQGTAKQYIWPENSMPDAQPHQIAAMTSDSKKQDFQPDEWRRPYIEWCATPENPNGTCMILISGGSYRSCCDVGLIKQWTETLTGLGCQCVNLVYRTPWPKELPIYQTAWEDAQRAVRLVRSQAAARGFDPEKIGTVSMSAGSHLATLLATSSTAPAYARIDDLDDLPCNVNWSIVFAPAFVLNEGYGKPDSRMGEGPDVKLDECFKFDGKTPPMCLLHGGKDQYSPIGSTKIYRELRKRGIPAEVHIVPGKGHGAFGLDRAVEFMRQMGFLGKPQDEVLLMNRYPSDSDRAEYAKEPLWPEGKIPDFQQHQNIPYLEWHIPSNLTTRAIQMIWSGGSYNYSDPNGFEVAPMRRFLNAKGMAVVTVKYRYARPKAPLPKHLTAWQDAQRAIKMVRSEAEKRGLDPNKIGIMGSSAGGHLALMCATTAKTHAYWPIDDIDKISPAVQWAVAVYPAYALTDGLDAHNSQGGNSDDARLAPEFAFDLDTAPTYFIHGDADGWAAMNSVKAWEQMRRMGIQGELHTLATRKHCFQKQASPGTGSYNWMDHAWQFISAQSK